MSKTEMQAAKIAFSWKGLPQYAAPLMRTAIDCFGEDCIVVGSKPSVPVKGMEELLGRPWRLARLRIFGEGR